MGLSCFVDYSTERQTFPWLDSSTELLVTEHAIPSTIGRHFASMQYSRECGGCLMCCKFYKIPALDKPAGNLCVHCAPAQGCTIYGSRPDQCRELYCRWIKDADIPDYWKPDRTRIILTTFPGNGFLYAQVDPDRPNAWKQSKLLADLKRWASIPMRHRRHVIVFVRDQATLIIPDQTVMLGSMHPGEGFALRPRKGCDLYLPISV